MFENFPYTDMHQLNLDWIVKVVKDFEEHYTELNEAIEQGKTEIAETAAAELARIVQEINNYEGEVTTDIEAAIAEMNRQAAAKLAEVLSQIPSDYTVMYNQLALAYNQARYQYKNDIINKDGQIYRYIETVGANAEWDPEKVKGDPLGRFATGALNKGDINAYSNPYQNMLVYANRLDGIAIRYSDGYRLERPNLTTFERIPVTPGARIIMSETLQSNTYGYEFSEADGSYIVDVAGRRIPSNINSGIIVPDTAYWFTWSCRRASADTAFVYVIKPESNNIKTLNPYYVNAPDQSVNGFPYNAFPSLYQFGNKKIITFGSRPQHPMTAGEYGGTSIGEIDSNGFVSIKKFYGYTGTDPWSGELNSLILSSNRAGNKLLAAGFTARIVNNEEVYENVIFDIDPVTYDILDYNIVANTTMVLFGRVLETPDHHLIVSRYLDTNIEIARSNEVYTGSNLRALTWSYQTIITDETSTSEGSLAYVGNKLVLVARRQTTNALYCDTEDLEGLTGWTEKRDIGTSMHAPMMLPYTPGNVVLIIGAAYVDSEHRNAVIAAYDTVNHALIQVNKYADTRRFDGYGDLIKLDNDNYLCAYYTDPEAGFLVATIRLKTVNIRELLPAMQYIS